MSDNSHILKNGNKILIDQQPFLIIENEFVNPGKGQAFTRVKIRNLLNSKVLEKTIKIGESIQEADVFNTKMQYLYKEADKYYFMNLESFEQIQVDETIVSQNSKWLIDGNDCDVTIWNGEIIQVSASKYITLKIVSTVDAIKGDTVSSTLKEATVENGETIMVPIFIKEGESIRIDTENDTYASREKSDE